LKFRGLDPRTRILRWGLLAVAVGIVLGGSLPSAMTQLAAAAAAQHDSLPWYATRLLAFLSYLAISGSVVYGLLLSTRLLDAIAHRPISFTLHQDLASVGLGLAAVHGMLLALDRSVPFSLAEIVVPFASPYRPLWVGVGQVGLYITGIVVASFYVRRRIGQRAWRALHYLTFLAFIGSTAHGLMTGTDSGSAWAWGIYVGSMVTVVFLLAYRISVSVTARAKGTSRRQPAARVATGGPIRETADRIREPGIV
jgi:predicted ferric reductase